MNEKKNTESTLMSALKSAQDSLSAIGELFEREMIPILEKMVDLRVVELHLELSPDEMKRAKERLVGWPVILEQIPLDFIGGLSKEFLLSLAKDEESADQVDMDELVADCECPACQLTSKVEDYVEQRVASLDLKLEEQQIELLIKYFSLGDHVYSSIHGLLNRIDDASKENLLLIANQSGVNDKEAA